MFDMTKYMVTIRFTDSQGGTRFTADPKKDKWAIATENCIELHTGNRFVAYPWHRIRDISVEELS